MKVETTALKLGTLWSHEYTPLIYRSMKTIQKLIGFSLDLNMQITICFCVHWTSVITQMQK